MGRWGQRPCKVPEVEAERRLVYGFGVWRLIRMLRPIADGGLLGLDREWFDLYRRADKHAHENAADGWK